MIVLYVALMKKTHWLKPTFYCHTSRSISPRAKSASFLNVKYNSLFIFPVHGLPFTRFIKTRQTDEILYILLILWVLVNPISV